MVALDKTGTITTGQPRVTDVLPAPGVTDEQLIAAAYALEQKSEHPLAHAVVERAQNLGLKAQEVSDFAALPGNGLTAMLDGEALSGGSLAFISGRTEVSGDMRAQADHLSGEGKTPLLFSRGGRLSGHDCRGRRHQA